MTDPELSPEFRKRLEAVAAKALAERRQQLMFKRVLNALKRKRKHD